MPSNESGEIRQAALIKSFGFTSKKGALLSVSSSVIDVIVSLSSSWIAGSTNWRLMTLMCYFPFGITSASLMAFLPPSQKAGKMTGHYFTSMVPNTPLVYTIAAANFSGHTKGITVHALILISFSTDNIIVPLTFIGAIAPAYKLAKIAMIACFSMSLCLVILRCMFKWEDKRRNEKGEVVHVRDSEFMNLTDRQNGEYRVSAV
ncbi:hypothetical protein BDZ45DRAFT_752325 [Acephala macrosclerotiorum]|nr:hypothetical protein BDZ45DRAFT_752325 [Acephala macrosclerotiorum]